MKQSTQGIVVFGRNVSNINELIDVLCDEVEEQMGISFSEATPSERREIVQRLDNYGTFALRYAAIRIAKRMMVSKVTFYSILNGLSDVTK